MRVLNLREKFSQFTAVSSISTSFVNISISLVSDNQDDWCSGGSSEHVPCVSWTVATNKLSPGSAVLLVPLRAASSCI